MKVIALFSILTYPLFHEILALPGVLVWASSFFVPTPSTKLATTLLVEMTHFLWVGFWF